MRTQPSFKYYIVLLARILLPRSVCF